jgi:copper homeostasis protein
MILEICVDSVESAMAAARGGAGRIELYSALCEGGITPSAGLIGAVRRAVAIDLYAIIRPRGGDFVYSEREYEVMREDIRIAKEMGVDGVVFGLLDAQGMVDTARTRSLIELARPMGVTFHRAFDVSTNLDQALEQVIDCGADRLLTSGGETDALRGMNRIARLNKAAGGRLRIMAGGGVRESNVRKLVQHCGVGEVHTSLSTQFRSSARHGNPDVHIGLQPNEFMRFPVLEEDVRRFKTVLDAIPVVNAAESSVQ